MNRTNFLLIFFCICSSGSNFINAQTLDYKLVKTISYDEPVRELSVTKDYFLSSFENIVDNSKTIIARDFDGNFLFKIERSQRNTGSLISSYYSNQFGVTNFDRSRFYDNEYSLDYLSYDIYNSKGEFIDTVSSNSGLDLFLFVDQIAYIKKLVNIKVLNRSTQKEIVADNGFTFHSFGDSLLLFINYYIKTQGNEGFEKVLEKQKVKAWAFRDSTKLLREELNKIRRNPQVSRELFMEWRNELQKKIQLERNELITKNSLEKDRYEIQSNPESYIMLYNPFQDSTIVETPINLSREEKFNSNKKLQFPREIPASISKSYIVTSTNINNGLGSISIFEKSGKRLHDINLKRSINTAKIVADSLLLMSSGNELFLFELESGKELWRKRISNEYRFKFLHRQGLDQDEVFILVGERIELNKYALSISNLDLKTGELINSIELDKELDDFNEVEEIESGFIYVQNSQVSENEFDSKIMIYRKFE